MPRAQVVPVGELTWTEVRKPDGTPLGIRTTDLWGHAAAGPHGSLTTFPAGLAEPLHRHSNGIRVVVISGVMIYVIDGARSRDLGVGSYVSVGADVPHYAQCSDTGPCEVIIMQDGPMDVKAEPPR
jgi:quercetin dioxygenase-like cupin family protein